VRVYKAVSGSCEATTYVEALYLSYISYLKVLVAIFLISLVFCTKEF
jgi:hypothetical protein